MSLLIFVLSIFITISHYASLVLFLRWYAGSDKQNVQRGCPLVNVTAFAVSYASIGRQLFSAAEKLRLTTALTKLLSWIVRNVFRTFSMSKVAVSFKFQWWFSAELLFPFC